MAHGILTAKVADRLSAELESQGFYLIHDHAQPGADLSRVGKARSWFGPTPAANTMLADLDIAVAATATRQLFALIEVEESNCKPKLLLGDVMATLLGSNIRIRGQSDLEICDGIYLIILAYSTNDSQRPRIKFLEDQTNLLKGKLDTPNAKKIGRVIIDTFRDELELEEKLGDLIQDAWIAVQH